MGLIVISRDPQENTVPEYEYEYEYEYGYAVVGGALEHHELLGFRSDHRDRLDRRGAGPDHTHPQPGEGGPPARAALASIPICEVNSGMRPQVIAHRPPHEVLEDGVGGGVVRLRPVPGVRVVAHEEYADRIAHQVVARP